MPTHAFLLSLFVVSCLMGCQGDNEPRNEAEIVKRSSDTTFSAVPGNDPSVREADDIVEVLELNGLEAAREALVLSGLSDSLKGEAAITFFAPSDGAFTRLRNNQKLNKKILSDLLLNHAVNGIIAPEDLINGKQLTTLNGKRLTVNIQENKLKINNAAIVDTHLAMANGIIYKISDVIRTN